jgi:3-oxoacyl-[acyl-carrier-protein] synthase-1
LTALGIVTSLGSGTGETWPRLLCSDQSRFYHRSDLVPDRKLLVGGVAEPLPEIPQRLARFACRNNQMVLSALSQLEKPIADAVERFGAQRVGVAVGSSTSGVGDAERAIRHQHETGELSKQFDYEQLEFGGVSSFVADWLGVDGPSYAISTACSSGARALATARSLLTLGVCDAVVAGATDTLCGLTCNGFTSLQVVSERITNPCSVNRDGLTLGEGSALFLVTRDPGGVQLLGVGESTEAHHMSAPDPEGRGAEQAMLRALDDAALEPHQIAYLNFHGTGTQLNDAMECSAVSRVFPSGVACSSTKGLVGHTLGAAGAVEAGFCWMALSEQSGDTLDLIPHAFDGALDPELGAPKLVTQPTRVPAGPVMTNSFGFGGNNCTLVLSGGPS